MAVQRGTITEENFYSKELDEEITFLLYKPANFSPLFKYSLIIVQDGKDYFQMGRLPRLVDSLLENEEIENVIIAGIPYRNVEDRRRKYHPDGEQNQAYIRFLAHELTPYLDETFPTYHINMGRALMGDSLAATVSLMTALQYPNIFGKVVMHSPYVDEKVLNAVQDCEDCKHLAIYHVIGQEETEVETTDGKIKDFLTPNRQLHQALKEKGLRPFYDEFAGNHTWKYWQPDLKRAMLHMFE